MLKKVLATVLAGTMGLTMITGCGEKEVTDVEDTGKVQLDLWYSGGKTAVNVFQEIVDEFNASQDIYEVKTVTQADYDETYEKLQAGIAGNKAPDMALLDVDKSVNLSEKNLIADIAPYIEADQNFDKEDYLPVFFEQGIDKDGKVFAIPAYGTTQVFYYNKEAFDKAGIDPESIKTWQDLGKAAEKMTAEDGSFIGWEPMWGSENLMDIAFSNGGSILSDDGTEVLINSEEWVESWESIRKWIHEDKVMKVNSGGQGWEYWYTTMDDVLQNRAGGYIGSSGDQADLDFSIVGAMEQPGFNENMAAPAANALQLVMLESSSDEEKEGVYEFMKFFSNAKNQGKWSMNTGYVPVRFSTQEDETYAAYTLENPNALVPFNQASHGTPAPVDPTGGKILDALKIAADKVELENIPAKEALDEAKEISQKALDEIKK